MTQESSFLFLGTPDDEQYLPALKGLFGAFSPWIICAPIQMLSHLEMYCRKKGITKVVSTSSFILEKLLSVSGAEGSTPSIDNYQGSLFTWKNLEIVFISPLSQLHTVSYGRFLAERFISKLTNPAKWREPTPFKWTIVTPQNVQGIYEEFSQALYISVDIETFRKNLAIRCIGYCAIWISNLGVFETHSIVLPLDDIWALAWMRKFNSLPAPKIFQNGKYDNSYLLRYNSPIQNWIWDTAHLFHSYYSELPKDLGFLNSFFLRAVKYWKDLSHTPDIREYYKYNALDTWATANVFLELLREMPEWAMRNYQLEFPLVFPCLLAEMTGLKRDMKKMVEARIEIDRQEAEALSSLRKMIGAPNFNPSSPKQVVQLLKLLGCGDIKSSGEKEIDKAKLRHPLNGRVLEKVLIIRGLRKLKTTYLRLDSDGEEGKNNGSKEYKQTILYSLNPHGTDTGRLASREHHFWTGLQIHNIPVGEDGELSWTKTTIRASSGFYLAECDLEQAETRDTAYIAGETTLIKAVNSTRDFHSNNASAFFGVSYESIYDDAARKSKNKPLRNIAKRVNHGANYNMGGGVLIDTMGLEAIWNAKVLLALPYSDPKEIANHLLGTFHATYPKLKGSVRGIELYKPGTYYASVAYEVATTKRITSRAFHHTEYNLKTYTCSEYIERGDWTRYCFGKPDKSKLDLNSYVAHPPQSLNARTLNEAFLRVFYEIALPNPSTFRLHAQIHDSILFSYAPGTSHPERVRECMEIPVSVKDISGITRTFTVPAALKIGKKDKPAIYWSETE